MYVSNEFWHWLKQLYLMKDSKPWLLIGCWGRHCVKSKVMVAVDWVRARQGYSHRGCGSASRDSRKSRERWIYLDTDSYSCDQQESMSFEFIPKINKSCFTRLICRSTSFCNIFLLHYFIFTNWYVHLYADDAMFYCTVDSALKSPKSLISH